MEMVFTYICSQRAKNNSYPLASPRLVFALHRNGATCNFYLLARYAGSTFALKYITTTTPGYHEITFQAPATEIELWVITAAAPGSSITYYLDDVTVVMDNEDGKNYRFGMNTQEKDDEIFVGAYSAEYWEYDSRLGRRWNVDPVVKPHESSYACFANNPIMLVDPEGNDTLWTDSEGKVETKIEAKGQNIVYQWSGWQKDDKGKNFRTHSQITFHDSKDQSRVSDFEVGDQMFYMLTEENVNYIMQGSKIEPMSTFERWSMANDQSVGGLMDFPLILLHDVNEFLWENQGDESIQNGIEEGPPSVYNVGPFIMFKDEFKNSSYHHVQNAYNIFDAGQFLWGQAMNRMGFSLKTALFFADANEYFQDSYEDQQAIWFGYMYKGSTKRASANAVFNGLK